MVDAFPGSRSRLTAETADIHVLVLSDSTANNVSEWPYLWANDILGTTYPAYDVLWEAWDGTGESWGTESALSSGSGSYAIKIWQGAAAGYGCDEYLARETAIIQHPTDVDYCIISLGLNTTRTQDAFESLISMVQSNWPDAYVALVTQNPRYDDYELGVSAWAAVEGAAATYGCGVVDVGAAFLSNPDPESNLMADDTHPNAAGSAVYRDTIQSAFASGGGVVGILSRAVASMQASNYAGTGNWLDESGNGHNAALTGTKFLEYGGTQYVYLPGVSNNGLTLADDDALELTGDWDIRAKVALETVGSGSDEFTVVCKAAGYGAGEWGLRVGAGVMTMLVNSGALRTVNSTTELDTVGVADNEVFWLRCTGDVSEQTITFYYSQQSSLDDPADVTWTQLGDAVDVGAAITPSANVRSVHIGTRNLTADLRPGSVYQVWIASTIGASTADVLYVHAADAVEGSSTFAERANAKTVTINRGSSGYSSTLVTRSQFVFDGTDDVATISDHDDLDFAADEPFTVLVLASLVDNDGAYYDPLIFKATTVGSVGWRLYRYTGSTSILGRIADASLSPYDTGTAKGDNTWGVYALRRSVAADEVEVFVDSVGTGSPTTDTTTGTLANSVDVTIGSGASTFLRGGVAAVALFREALTDTEIAQVGNLLVNGGAEDFVVTFAPLARW